MQRKVRGSVRNGWGLWVGFLCTWSYGGCLKIPDVRAKNDFSQTDFFA